MEKKQNKDTLIRCFRYAVILLAGWWLINNFAVIGNAFSAIVNVVLPFIIGGAIAFIINIPMAFFESKMSKIKNKVIKRLIAIVLALAVVSVVIYLIINLILPELISIINLLISNIPYYIDEIKELAVKWNLTDYIKNIELNPDSIKEQVLAAIPGIFTSSLSIVGSVVGAVSNAVIAIIFAIYVLAGKEKIASTLKQLIYTYLTKKKADKVINFGTLTNSTFKSFFTVQCLEATILGVLCFIGMLILKVPYAVPISVLIGVTALVPVVGGIVGIIIGAILILAIEPAKALPFIIFVVILQQFEGNVIYPKVVGDSIGLPGILVLIAVTIGGNIGGVLGMLLSVPVASIIFKLVKKDVELKASKDIKKA